MDCINPAQIKRILSIIALCILLNFALSTQHSSLLIVNAADDIVRVGPPCDFYNVSKKREATIDEINLNRGHWFFVGSFGHAVDLMANGKGGYIDYYKSGNQRIRTVTNFTCNPNRIALASIEGEITYSNACGLSITISRDDGVQVRYCHLAKRSVPQNTQVVAGQSIGLIGNTGFAQGIHLHFEVMKNGAKLSYTTTKYPTKKPLQWEFAPYPEPEPPLLQGLPKVSAIEFDGSLTLAMSHSDDSVFTRRKVGGKLTPNKKWGEWDEYGKSRGNINTIVHNGKLYQAVIGQSTTSIFYRVADGTLNDDLLVWSEWQEVDLDLSDAYEAVWGRYADTLFLSVSGVNGANNIIYTLQSSSINSDGTINWNTPEGEGRSKNNATFVNYNGYLYQLVPGENNGSIFYRYTDLSINGETGTIWSEFASFENHQALSDINAVVLTKPNGASILYLGYRDTKQTVRTLQIKLTSGQTNLANNIVNEDSVGKTAGEVTMTVYNNKVFQAVRGATTSLIWTRSSKGSGWTNWKDYIAEGFDGRTSGDVAFATYNNTLYMFVLGRTNKDTVFVRLLDTPWYALSSPTPSLITLPQLLPTQNPLKEGIRRLN